MSNWPTIVAGTLIMFALILGFGNTAHADGFKVRDIRIEAAGGWAHGNTEEVETGLLYRGTLGVDSWPVYLYAQEMEMPGVAIRGQNVSGGKLRSAGIGFERGIAKGLSVFAEAGYMTNTFGAGRPDIVQEVVYTQVVGEHAVDEYRFTPILTERKGRSDGYKSEWSLDDTYEFRVGLKYQLTEYGFASISYRYGRAQEFYRIYDEAWIDKYGRSWWEEHKQRDLGGVEFMIGVRF